MITSMMSLGSTSVGLPMAKPLLPNNQPVLKQPATKETAASSNTAGLSQEDLNLLRALLAASEESKPTDKGVSPEKMPSADSLKAQYKVTDNPICKRDGNCGACSPEEELLS